MITYGILSAGQMLVELGPNPNCKGIELQSKSCGDVTAVEGVSICLKTACGLSIKPLPRNWKGHREIGQLVLGSGAHTERRFLTGQQLIVLASKNLRSLGAFRIG